jgi:hypothetical protein
VASALYENGIVQQPTLDDRDLIEARSLRRRQVLAALLRGGDGRPESSSAVARRGFVIGVVLSLVIAVVVGIAGLVDASRQHHS